MVWNEGLDHLRQPADHLDVDLVSAGLTGTCLAVHTAAPLPEHFTLKLGLDDISVDVHGRTVLVSQTRQSDDTEMPIAGVVASINANQIVVQFPQAPSEIHDFTLVGWRAGVEYGDTHSFG